MIGEPNAMLALAEIAELKKRIEAMQARINELDARTAGDIKYGRR